MKVFYESVHSVLLLPNFEVHLWMHVYTCMEGSLGEGRLHHNLIDCLSAALEMAV